MLINDLSGHADYQALERFAFRPWIGVRYDTLGLDGRRLLILGESHYESTPGDVKTRTEYKLTWDIIDRAIAGESLPFYSKIATAVSGEELTSSEERSGFWKTVAFYNYVQRLLKTPGERPSATDLKSGAAPFFDLIRLLSPDAILVTGVTVWNSISDCFPEGARSTEERSDEPSSTYRWEGITSYPILATWTVHPSDFHSRVGFTDPKWRTRVSRFVNEMRTATGRGLRGNRIAEEN